MLVETTRFGQVQSSQEEVIVFPQGLIGFESSRHWIIIPDRQNDSVAWLQSLTQAEVAMPLVSPRKFAPEYRVCVPQRHLAPIKLRNSDRIYVLSVVSKSGKTLTINLRSPVVINLTQRLACQVITSDPLPLKLPVSLMKPTQVRLAA